MPWNSIAHPFWTALLACVAPVLGFISLNLSAYRPRQVLCSILFAILLGGAAGCAFIVFDVPEILAAGVGLSVFFLLNQRFFRDVLPGPVSRRVCIAALFTGGMLLSFFFSTGIINLLLLAYLFFGVIDFIKNRKFFNNQYNRISAGDKVGVTAFTKKPNIYILYLESMQPKKILEDLYDSHDLGLHTYLTGKEFTVFDRHFSNSDSTLASFSDIFGMKSCKREEAVSLQALSIVKQNGYKTHLLDIHRYLQPFAAAFDKGNFGHDTFPGVALNLLRPLFELVPTLGKVFHIGDVYEKNLGFDSLLQNISKVTQDANGPHCCTIRFGAGHSPCNLRYAEGFAWRSSWRNTYLNLYRTAVDQCKRVIDLLTEADPDCCIVALGDHGAHFYRWAYNADGSLMNIDAKMSHSLVARDIFSVLMAVRCPGAKAEAFEGMHSHVNVLRYLFRALGARGDILDKQEDNLSVHSSHNTIMARDGVALSAWEKADNSLPLEAEGGQSQAIINDASLLMQNGRFEDAATLLSRTLHIVPDKAAHINMLSTLLFRTGKAGVAENSIRGELALHRKGSYDHAFYSLLLGRCLMYQGKHQEALRTADFLLTKNSVPLASEQQSLMNELAIVSGDLAKAAKQIEKRDSIFLLASLKRALDKPAEALRELERAQKRPAEIFLTSVVALELGKYRLAEERARAYIDIDAGLSPLPQFLLAGILELEGKKEEAFQVLCEARQTHHTNGLVHRILGLYLIRNRRSEKDLELCRRAAYMGMAEDREMLRANGFFDEEWYRERYGHLLHGMEPLRHYLLNRNILFLNPNPYFDYAWYALINPDAVDCGISPDRHYLICSPCEQRDPSAVFSTTAYVNRHPEVLRANVNPLAHFIWQEKKAEEKKNAA